MGAETAWQRSQGYVEDVAATASGRNLGYVGTQFGECRLITKITKVTKITGNFHWKVDVYSIFSLYIIRYARVATTS